MQTISTLFRAVVMFAALAIAWKGWQLYGPSNDQLRSMASRAAEIAQEALQGVATQDAPIADPRLAPPTLADPSNPPIGPSSLAVAPAAAELLPAGDVVEPARFEIAGSATEMAPDVTRLPAIDAKQSSTGSAAIPADDDQVKTMIARLEATGVRDSQLEPWGSSGELYRFSCRVPWGETAAFTRHFESIASKPASAVAAVAEKVDAWRLAENGATTLR